MRSFKSLLGTPFGMLLGMLLIVGAACEATHETPQGETEQAQVAMLEDEATTAPVGKPRMMPQPVLLPVPDDATISFSLWFKVGSQNDPPGKEGLANLTAELLAQGATTKNSYDEVLAKLYPLASSYSVRVDREMTTFRGRTHRDNLEAFYELYTDAVLHPVFDSSDFERLRGDMLNAIENQLRYASDEEFGKAAFYSFMFDGTPYRHPEVGTVQSLKALTVDDVKQFYGLHYNSSNCVVALGGGYPGDLPGRMRKSMQSLPVGAPIPPPDVRVAAFDGRKVMLVQKPDADASISFGFPINVKRGERDFYALWLANSWLGEHRNSSSHLYQVIRTARGMNYGDYSYIEAYPGGGRRQKPPTNVARNHQCFEVWIRTLKNEPGLFALRAALRELTSLVDNGLTQEQFDLTQSFLDKYILHFAETTQQRLGYAVDDRFYGIDDSHLERFRKIIKSLTLDEVNAAIRKHLQYDNIKIAIITGEAEMLKETIASDRPTPVVYDAAKSDDIMAEDQVIAALPFQVRAQDIQIVPVEQMFEK